jgi:hypothetical protein
MEEESIVVLEVGFLASNIKKKVFDVLGFIFIFWENMNKRKFIMVKTSKKEPTTTS